MEMTTLVESFLFLSELSGLAIIFLCLVSVYIILVIKTKRNKNKNNNSHAGGSDRGGTGNDSQNIQ